MNANFITWPTLPTIPEHGAYVLLKCDSNQYSGSDKHVYARKIITETLADWLRIDRSSIKLEESYLGPVFFERILDDYIYISISYCGDEIWIAFSRGKEIGLDVTLIKLFPELLDVAKIYFDHNTQALIINSTAPEYKFSYFWSRLEAKIKLTKSSLTEHVSRSFQDSFVSDVNVDSFFIEHAYVSVAQ
jgi:phosphopantetheinyl transferase